MSYPHLPHEITHGLYADEVTRGKTIMRLRELVLACDGSITAMVRALQKQGQPSVARTTIHRWLKLACLEELAANARRKAGITGPRKNS